MLTVISNSDIIDEFEQSLKRIYEEKQNLQTGAEKMNFMTGYRRQRLSHLDIRERLLKKILLRLYQEQQTS